MVDERSSRNGIWITLIICATALAIFTGMSTLLYVMVRPETDTSEYGIHGDKIGVVDIDGVILDAEPVVRDLKKFAEDGSIKAIILHLDTPGGGAAASEEISREVRTIRAEKKKPVIASIATVGASGGYYIASAADKIYSDEASVVGSIGVIAEWYNYGELLRWAKLKEIVIAAGEFKDTGDPARDLTPAERDYLQGMIENMHGQFISAVAEGRKMKVDDVRAIANGKVWTGEEALKLNLVDSIGGFQEAVKATAQAAGIKGEPTIVKPQHPHRSIFDIVFGDASDLMPNPARLVQKNMGFYFLWRLQAR